MWDRLKLSTLVTAFITVIMTLFLIVMAIVVTSMAKTAYNQDETSSDIDRIRELRAHLETEAGEILAYMELSEQKSALDMRSILKERVDSAYELALWIYRDSVGKKSIEEIETEIGDALRAYRFDGGLGYYFMDRFDGEVMLYPVRPELEGSNALNLKDAFGNFVLRDEINIASRHGAGFSEGNWLIPGNEGSESKALKVSYIRRFESLDWYIGTGMYENLFLEAVKSEVIQDLEVFKAQGGVEDQYFVAAADGTLLVGQVPEGTSEARLEEKIQDMAKSMSVSYIELDESDEEDNESASALYLAKFEPWGWIVGTHGHVPSHTLARRSYQLENSLDTLKQVTLFLGVVLTAAVVLFNRLFSAKLGMCFESVGKAIRGGDLPEADREACFKEFSELHRSLDDVEGRKKTVEAGLVPYEVLTESAGLRGRDIHTAVEGEAVAAGAAHQLRQILKDEPTLTQAQTRALQRIRQDLSALQKLLTRWNRDTHSNASEMPVIHHERMYLRAFLENVLQLVVQEYTSIDIQARVVCDRNLIVVTDPVILTQIITHLATNAVIHGMENRDRGALTLEVIYDENHLRICMIDDGHGMEPAVLERVFEPYFSTSADGESIGLGLPEVYDLVNNTLGGAINCTSRIGFGTEFFIDIPGNGPGLFIETDMKTEKSG